MAHLGPCLGKGDAMWRALTATAGDVVCFIDADTVDFAPHFAVGMLGPLLTEPEVAFVKGTFRRPMRVGEAVNPDGGGRVTELMARPLLSLVAPDLGGFGQPLAGETAARADLLAEMPFPVGYGVETAMLIDAHRVCGLDAMAQVEPRVAPEPAPAAARAERDGAGRALHRAEARAAPRDARRARPRAHAAAAAGRPAARP